jgi:hypothetical protein
MSVNNNQERMMNKEPATDIPELMDNARNMLGEVSIGEGTMCWDGAGEVLLFVGMEKTRDDGMVGVDAVLESTTTTVFRRNNRQAWGIVYKFCTPPILLLNTVVYHCTVQSEGPPGPPF